MGGCGSNPNIQNTRVAALNGNQQHMGRPIGGQGSMNTHNNQFHNQNGFENNLNDHEHNGGVSISAHSCGRKDSEPCNSPRGGNGGGSIACDSFGEDKGGSFGGSVGGGSFGGGDD